VIFKSINKVCQTRAYAIKKGDGTTVEDTTSSLSKWENFYSNLFSVS
jgi:hypothetical protein